ncbi:putative bifunctional diguanylate cyclase/phosphodiesterase [Idiomarina aminovorans]|uniref:putative bifunctional diguanylate cyclase/phosphodiesterase n=1 Tax=Idiomarina aminovorans TaxID=2914829 RepID=UPI0020053EE5|nr:bifunctional diguanylate cyclase/phosphodiesterase [Idiomarina sp. ATCH4]MCK7459810.1 bifunctional diguanylate cyclase/phosphodiesterase [Idiomarina sp. ATCH4]
MPQLDLITSLAIETFAHAIQAVFLIGFALLLMYYHRYYRREYLQYWSFACFAFGPSELIRAFLAGSAIIAPESALSWSSGLQGISLTFHYLAISFVVLGATCAIFNSKPQQYWQYLAYGISLLAGIISYFWLDPAISSVGSTPSSGFMRFLVTGATLIVIGLIMWRKLGAGVGPKLVSAGFLSIGLKNFLVLAAMFSLSGSAVDWILSFQSLLTVIIVAVVIVGIIIWLLESERNTAVRAIQRAEYLHTHDALTGVSNREQLVSKIPLFIEYCRGNNRHLTIVLIGISRFKVINENIGIRGGDQVLKEIARRLQNFAKQPLTVARISGDVFAIAFDHLKSRSLIEELASQLQDTLSKPIDIGEKSLNIAAGIGVSRYPQHGSRSEVLLNKATIALTQAKQSHQPIVTIYQRGMDEMYSYLVDMEPVLRKAMRENEFTLYLQPQFDFDHQQLCGFEALIRWQHPERGLLTPAEFLPYIEQLGLSTELDDWVLDHAAAILTSWQEKFGCCWPVAVNLSAPQFQHFQLIEKMKRLLQDYNISPEWLELEITENVAMSDLHNGMSVIQRLREMGFGISIDDFGTGHSSLAYLRSLPINKIKIDRSFVSELQQNDNDVTILKAMIRLSHGLGKRVIAEGIETQEQQDILQKLGCDMMQGYFYSPPMRLQFAEQLIERQMQDNKKPLPPGEFATA